MSARCVWGKYGPVACRAHAEEANEASRLAREEEIRTSPRAGQELARIAGAVGFAAHQRALERPLTRCSDGSLGLGWTFDDDEDAEVGSPAYR